MSTLTGHGGRDEGDRLSARGLADRLRTHPRVYRTARSVVLATGHYLPPRRIDGIPGRVHRNDLMLPDTSPDSVRAYTHVGRQAVELLGQATESVGRALADSASVLDLGSGHGRVLRWIVQDVEPARVTACDLDPEAVAFCRNEFGVRGVDGDESLSGDGLGSYDLAWAGSLATHLPRSAFAQFADLLSRVVQAGGVAVFTTHGPDRVAEPAPAYAAQVAPLATSLTSELDANGFAYLQYAHYARQYGLAFHADSFVDREFADRGFERTMFRPMGWDHHQDVHVFRRV